MGAQETMKNNSMMDVNKGVYLVGIGWYVALLRKVKQGLERNKERLTLIKVWGSESLRARI
jgi:hypothetical protein